MLKRSMKARALGLGLALAMMAAQPVRAEILITPFDGPQSAEGQQTNGPEQDGSQLQQGQSGQQSAEGQQTNGSGQYGPGMDGTQYQPEQDGPQFQPGQSKTGTGSEQGPGYADSGTGMMPSGSYSTKEPVSLPDSGQPALDSGDNAFGPGWEGNTAGPGTENSQSGPGAVSSQTEPGGPSADNGNGQPQQAALPKEPEIASKAAILYDVTDDRFLFEKDADTHYYPASITKLMTAILVLENAGMDETVTFSKTAVTNLESGAVTLGTVEGDQISVRDCMYGLLLRSANEIANGLAEHVGGSISGFADMMNAKAKALGCTDTNFVNPNGLNDPNHYTTARDMARIAKAAFANETLCQIDRTLSYKFPALKKTGAQTIVPGHKMLYPTDSRYYSGIVGGKTGYTSLAGNTLVTCVERDGVRLIAVVLKSQNTHYADTKAMLDYGFELCAAGQAGMAGQPANGTDPGAANGAYNRWIKDGGIWRFEFAGGARAADCLITIDGEDYLFDAEGRMLTGWQSRTDAWYYFKSSGAMAKNEWRQDGAYWFYLGADGRMLKNTWIDGYYVGENGEWIEGQSAS